MITIPQQLKLQRFIKTIQKIPCENSWTTIANYDINNQELLGHLAEYNSYGVLTGYNNLLVIDCDNKEIQESLLKLELFKDTFTVRTAGKGLLHFYFYTDEPPKSFKLLDKDKHTLLDGQGIGKQVIGPNSILENGKSYDIVSQSEIKIIIYNDIKKIMAEFNSSSSIITEEEKKDRVEFEEKDEVLRYIKANVKISDILKEANINIHKNPTDCPFHSSVGGKCLSYTDTLYHCFHCLKQGNIFGLYQEIHNTDFITAKRALAAMAGVDIPENNTYERVMLLLAQHRLLEATEVLVKDFLKTHSVYTTKNDIATEMWVYDGGIYKPNGKTEIKIYLRNLLGEDYKTTIISSVTQKIEADTAINQEDLFINEDIALIPVANGIYNWKTKELLEFSPKYKFFSKMPAIYNPQQDCPKIKQFFKDILIDENDIKVIQELFGYVLYRDYRFEKAFMFLGNGRNGKGKTLELMKLFIGAENCANVTLTQLENDNFALSTLFGKSANLSADISKTALKETGNFKSLTGHDLITAPRKFLPPISFVNHAKMIFLANELPQTYDDSIGFFDRWIMMDFKFRFHDVAKYPLIKNPIKFDKIADTEMITKLTTPEEMSGLLNWSLEGLYRLLAQNGFSFSTSTDDVKRKWKLRSSTFLTFFDECVDKDGTQFITKEDLREAYNKFCEQHQVATESDRAINFKLSDLGIGDKSKTVDGLFQKIWNGIKFKDLVITEKLKQDEVNFKF
jgi:P4 family phage/plasmid primase-like protien